MSRPPGRPRRVDASCSNLKAGARFTPDEWELHTRAAALNNLRLGDYMRLVLNEAATECGEAERLVGRVHATELLRAYHRASPDMRRRVRALLGLARGGVSSVETIGRL
jgi:hypothetical protein